MEEQKPQRNIQEGLKTIHTYSSDMADAVRSNEASVIKIALAEQKRNEMEAVYVKQEGTKTSKFFLFLGGIILIALAIGGSYFLLQEKNASNAPVQVIANLETLISYDDQAFVDVTTATNIGNLADAMSADIGKAGKQGTIKALFLTTAANGTATILPLEKFLSILHASAPGSLTRSLEDTYMVGVYQGVDAPHLFLLFQTKDYNQAYAGMLAWEKTLLDDLFGLFKIDVSGDRSELFEKPWKDIVIENKDARMLYDKDGAEVLYYLFINKNHFLITDNQDAIKEISNRVLAKNIRPL
jgi:hypothetical protein